MMHATVYYICPIQSICDMGRILQSVKVPVDDDQAYMDSSKPSFYFSDAILTLFCFYEQNDYRYNFFEWSGAITSIAVCLLALGCALFSIVCPSSYIKLCVGTYG
jgi:hypothetical protein